MNATERHQQRLALRRITEKPLGWSKLRDLILAELDGAYDRGYSAGHEDQMRMRILDAKERAK